MNLQFLADGLLAGAMIGLGAIGVTLTYSILRFANFAHGEFIAWGAYAALARRRRARRAGVRPCSRRSGRSPSAGRCSLAALLGDGAHRRCWRSPLDALLFGRLRAAAAPPSSW